jgi:hypothetical protein
MFNLNAIKDFYSEQGKTFVIGAIFSLLILYNLKEAISLVSAFINLDLSLTAFRIPLLELPLSVLPLIIWAWSTNEQFYNFRDRKKLMFHAAYASLNLLIIRFTFVVSYSIFVPFIVRIKQTEEMTVDLITGLGYLSTVIPMMMIGGLLLFIASKLTSLNRDFMKNIEDFRLFKIYDPELSNKYEYTFEVVRDIDSGTYTAISQRDRQMHTAIIGATGTAKTSSVFLPAILHDLIVRVRNKDALKKAFTHYVKKGLLRINTPFEDIDFSVKFFEPNSDYIPNMLERLIGRTPEQVYANLIKKYEIAGQTILAPEDSLPDDAYDLFTAYGEKVNRIDPKLIDGKLKPGFKGMNILYISPSMPEWAVERERVRRATLLADVMQIMFEMGGKSDPYFASVNRIATTTIALLLQLTYPEMKGRQANLIDVQECLNNFKNLIEPFHHLFPSNVLSEKNRKYLWLKENIQNFFLGDGAETFEQHARGLKVQFSLFLADDYIRNLVSAEDVIDFDEILANNELTVVNIELPEIGPLNSPALGLFFTVNMTNAVLRRPGNEWSRSFHVWRIDEFPIVVTPSMEQAFTLFRKFKVAMEVALQTLDQMEKTPFLKYLKSVIINSTANQIVFGRANISEMETYSTLSGMFDDVEEMEGITETSIFTDDPRMSIQRRKTKTKAFVNEQSDIRNKDFQEVTYFYTKRGSLMTPMHGKVEFLKKKDKRGPRKIKRYDWMKLYSKHSKDNVVDKPTLSFDDQELLKAWDKEEAVSEVIVSNLNSKELNQEISNVAVVTAIQNERPLEVHEPFSVTETIPMNADFTDQQTSVKSEVEPKTDKKMNEESIVEIEMIEIEPLVNEKSPSVSEKLTSSDESKDKRGSKFDFFN